MSQLERCSEPPKSSFVVLIQSIILVIGHIVFGIVFVLFLGIIMSFGLRQQSGQHRGHPAITSGELDGRILIDPEDLTSAQLEVISSIINPRPEIERKQ